MIDSPSVTEAARFLRKYKKLKAFEFGARLHQPGYKICWKVLFFKIYTL